VVDNSCKGPHHSRPYYLGQAKGRWIKNTSREQSLVLSPMPLTTILLQRSQGHLLWHPLLHRSSSYPHHFALFSSYSFPFSPISIPRDDFSDFEPEYSKIKIILKFPGMLLLIMQKRRLKHFVLLRDSN
jgi:hypothetical protein